MNNVAETVQDFFRVVSSSEPYDLLVYTSGICNRSEDRGATDQFQLEFVGLVVTIAVTNQLGCGILRLTAVALCDSKIALRVVPSH